MLGDPKKRANYDQFGSAEGNPFGGGSSAGGGFGDFFGGGGGFSDIFSDIFSAFGGGGTSARVQERGQDITVDMNLTFEEACFGCEKNITLSKIESCSSCKGTGAKNGKEFTTCPECRGTGRVRFQQKHNVWHNYSRSGLSQNVTQTGKIIKEKCPRLWRKRLQPSHKDSQGQSACWN